MNEKEAHKLLEYYNRWRRGDDIEMPNPKEVGEAIDVAIDALKRLIKAERNERKR